MEVTLVLNSGKNNGRRTPLGRGVYLVGRSRDCQIRPKNKSVSRKHCAIIHKKREVLLQDIGSKHGTYLNGEKLDTGVAVAISDGDEFQVGRSKFQFAITSGSNRTSVKQQSSSRKAAERDKEPASKEQPVSAYAGSTASPAGDFANELGCNEVELAELDKQNDEQPANGENVIDDILGLLQEDESDVAPDFLGAAQGGPQTHVGSNNENDEVDVDDIDEDGDVEFAAPHSADSIDGDNATVPSYQLRQDWDVNSVSKWVEQKQVKAPKKKLPQRKFKLKDPKKAKAADAEEAAREERVRKLTGSNETSKPTWLEILESDTLKPIAIGFLGLLFVAWILYNAWLIYSFEG